VAPGPLAQAVARNDQDVAFEPEAQSGEYDAPHPGCCGWQRCECGWAAEEFGRGYCESVEPDEGEGGWWSLSVSVEMEGREERGRRGGGVGCTVLRDEMTTRHTRRHKGKSWPAKLCQRQGGSSQYTSCLSPLSFLLVGCVYTRYALHIKYQLHSMHGV
jgi:hypothetical protein